MEQAGDLGQVTKAGQELVATIRNLALASEIDRLQESSDRFHEYLEHILEVCKLLRHIALSESLQVSAKFTEINLRIYGPQVVTAAHTLARYPTSKIAKENLEGRVTFLVSHFSFIIFRKGISINFPTK